MQCNERLTGWSVREARTGLWLRGHMGGQVGDCSDQGLQQQCSWLFLNTADHLIKNMTSMKSKVNHGSDRTTVQGHSDTREDRVLQLQVPGGKL